MPQSGQLQKGLPKAGRAYPRLERDALEKVSEVILFRRGRGKPFAPLGGFGLWLRFGRLLDFFPAFVFASHGC